uniref:Uncharacterized protein n=1 Tax=Rhizophora mucronata TaxID=61149 RepID=A0A2P2Q165_RHIMU
MVHKSYLFTSLSIYTFLEFLNIRQLLLKKKTT